MKKIIRRTYSNFTEGQEYDYGKEFYDNEKKNKKKFIKRAVITGLGATAVGGYLARNTPAGKLVRNRFKNLRTSSSKTNTQEVVSDTKTASKMKRTRKNKRSKTSFA